MSVSPSIHISIRSSVLPPLFAKLLDNSELKELPIKHVMEAPLPEVDGKASIEEVSKLFSNGATAVVVNYDGDKKHIITYQDVIRAIA